MESTGPSQPDDHAQDHRDPSTPQPLPPNPFAPVDGAEEDGVPSQQTVREGPRWWTPMVVIVLSLILFMSTSLFLSMTAIVVVTGSPPTDQEELAEGLKQVFASRVGLFVLVVLPQLAMVATPVIAAIVSPVPVRQRLGLVRGHWPLRAWVAAAAATPLVGLVSGLVVGLFFEESESLKQMSSIFRDHGENGFLFPLALMIGATPAICEELLFRGYVQTRLTSALGPAFGILTASFLFAIFHFDLVHVIAVFPLGLFLGWLTWKSGSLFPAILGHFVNNVISVVAVVNSPEDQSDVLALPPYAFTVGIVAAGIVGMLFVAAAAMRDPEAS